LPASSPLRRTGDRARPAARRPVIHAIRLYDGEDVDLVRRRTIAAGAPIVRPGTPGSQVIDGLLPAGAPELDPGCSGVAPHHLEESGRIGVVPLLVSEVVSGLLPGGGC
jgi:hypothetical protein